MMKTATSKDVAKVARVSRATVSNVINKTRYVSPKLAKKVTSAIEQLHYHPHLIAKSLVSRTTHSIGVVVARLASAFYPPLLAAIESTLAEKGYSMVLCDSSEDESLEARNLRMMAQRRVDGLLWVPCSDNNADFVRDLEMSGVPVVVVDRRIKGYRFDTVISDNEKAGRESTEYLVKRGYSKIAILTFSQKHSPARERLKGYQLAHKANGLRVEERFLCIAEVNEFEEAMCKITKLLQDHNRPEAIFACSDSLTLAAIKAIRSIGLNIPRDIALLGFDDSPWSEFVDPPISVMTQSTKDMGVLSANIILKKANGKKVKDQHFFIKVPTKLLQRRSCGESRKGVVKNNEKPNGKEVEMR